MPTTAETEMADDSMTAATMQSHDPKAAETYKTAGNQLFSQSKFDEAIKKYLQGIIADPTITALYTNAATCYARMEQHEKAIEMANEAISLAPSFTKAYYRRGASLHALGQHRRAVEDLRRVCTAAPADADAQRLLKECLDEISKAFADAIHMDVFELSAASIAKMPDPDAGYAGPLLPTIQPDGNADEAAPSVSFDFATQLIEYFKAEQRLPIKYCYQVMWQAKEALSAQPTLDHITIPPGGKLTICGDTHGQFFDLAEIFRINGFPSEGGKGKKHHAYLFNGDFVDRGAYSVEVILSLLALKAAMPSLVFLSRGNHEVDTVNRFHGFHAEVIRKYDEQTFSLFNRVMDTLPLAYVVQKKIFVVHGGLPESAATTLTLKDIEEIDRTRTHLSRSLTCQLLWSDPRSEPGIGESPRGEGVLFGPDVTEAFLSRNDLSMIVRSHVWEPTGYKIDHAGKCVTIFSAPNYTGAASKAAFINVDENLKMDYVQFSAAEYQGKAIKPKPAYGPLAPIY